MAGATLLSLCPHPARPRATVPAAITLAIGETRVPVLAENNRRRDGSRHVTLGSSLERVLCIIERDADREPLQVEHLLTDSYRSTYDVSDESKPGCIGFKQEAMCASFVLRGFRSYPYGLATALVRAARFADSDRLHRVWTCPTGQA